LHPTPRHARAAASVLVLFAAAACSSDGEGSAASTGPEVAIDGSEADAGGSGTNSSTPIDGFVDDPDNDRPFDATSETMGIALEAATSADRHEVDGTTITLFFSEGSTEGMGVYINCTAADAVTGADDTVILVYPDGQANCDDQ
jgi:hypothetical protein